MPFTTSEDALNTFVSELINRGFKILEVKTIRVNAGGKTIYQKQIWTESKEIFHVKYWTKKWIPKDSSKVSDFAKPLDERLKFSIRTFGNGDLSASGLNEDTMLELLKLNQSGFETFLITIYQSGEILWCRVDDFYCFATSVGLLPQYSGSLGEPFCWIPTGWFKKFESLKIAPPEVTQ